MWYVNLATFFLHVSMLEKENQFITTTIQADFELDGEWKTNEYVSFMHSFDRKRNK
jgi:hypothetical protein